MKKTIGYRCFDCLSVFEEYKPKSDWNFHCPSCGGHLEEYILEKTEQSNIKERDP
jgi:rRNA maturation endonuclease Nob1